MSEPLPRIDDYMQTRPTVFSPDDDIHTAIEAIHDLAGRTRGSEQFSSRPLDIDLLLYDDLIMEHSRFHLPRRDVLDYAFVLGPIVDIEPELRRDWKSFAAKPAFWR